MLSACHEFIVFIFKTIFKVIKKSMYAIPNDAKKTMNNLFLLLSINKAKFSSDERIQKTIKKEYAI
jgi:hypothetical protein